MEVTLASVLADIGTFFTSAIGWLGEALEVVMSNPALFIIVIAIPVSLFGVNLLRRMFTI